MKRRSLAIAGAAVAAAAALGSPLQAQGSSLDQHSACMAGRVGAGIASPCDDGSAIYFSPAALALQGSAVSGGAAVVRSSNRFLYNPGAAPVGELSPAERETETVIVPHLYASFKATPRLAAGIGVFFPYGLGLEWPVCGVDNQGCGNQFEGRYTGYDNSIRTMYVQPTLAYAITPDFAVGVGLDYVRATIDVSQRADAPNLGLSGRDIADAVLSGEGNTFTGHVSALLNLGPTTSIAARYLHSAEVEFEGDADFTQILTGTLFDAAIAAQFAEGQRLSDQPINTTVTFPSALVVGISHRPIEPLLLMLDYQRTGWSSFDAFDIVFEESSDTTVLNLGYRDANTFRLGAEYDATEALTLRAGFRYNTAATPRATPFLPEGERNYYTLGVGYNVTRALSADLAFQYINQPDRAGSVRPGASNAGIYEATGQIFGFTLAYRFGNGGSGR
jgi:long-chain fatty acid transport protein